MTHIEDVATVTALVFALLMLLMIAAGVLLMAVTPDER